MLSDFSRRLGDLGSSFTEGPVLVHSDVSRVLHAVRLSTDRQEVLSRHLSFLRNLAGSRALWFPTFNYGFPGTRAFDARHEPSEVGVLSEYARTRWTKWRTAVPIFSICGSDEQPRISDRGEVDPFGADSIFADLVARNGTILFYGAPIASATILHHAERSAGGPVYRYDKFFPGTVTDMNGERRDVLLKYHVRPKNRELEYDWPRLAGDLESQGLTRKVQEGASAVIAIPARSLVDYWVGRVRDDSLYLLNASSRSWVKPDLERLGRRFRIDDFES